MIMKKLGMKLSLDMIDKMLDHLGDRWTIAWMVSYTLRSRETEGQFEEASLPGHRAVARHFSKLLYKRTAVDSGTSFQDDVQERQRRR